MKLYNLLYKFKRALNNQSHSHGVLTSVFFHSLTQKDITNVCVNKKPCSPVVSYQNRRSMSTLPTLGIILLASLLILLPVTTAAQHSTDDHEFSQSNTMNELSEENTGQNDSDLDEELIDEVESEFQKEFTQERDDSGSLHGAEDSDMRCCSEKPVLVIVRDDTLFVFNSNEKDSLHQSMKKSIYGLREKGYGFSGGPTLGIAAVNLKPVEELIDNTPLLKNKSFSLSQYHYEPFIFNGGKGFIGLGKGVRIGGSGAHGQRHFVSAPYGQDSVAALKVDINYGGFLFEKTSTFHRWNITTGGTIGGGAIEVTMNTVDYDSYSFFDLENNDDDDNNNNTIKSNFFYFDPHGNFTYSFFPFFHLGVSVSAPLFFSTDGFSPYTSEYITVNPTFHITALFGNLG